MEQDWIFLDNATPRFSKYFFQSVIPELEILTAEYLQSDAESIALQV